LRRNPLDKLRMPYLFETFPAHYETWRFIAVFKKARHPSLSRATLIHSTPSHPIPSTSALLLSLSNYAQVFKVVLIFRFTHLIPAGIMLLCHASPMPCQSHPLTEPNTRCLTTENPVINLYTPNVNYSWRTAPLTSKVAFYIFIQQI